MVWSTRSSWKLKICAFFSLAGIMYFIFIGKTSRSCFYVPLFMWLSTKCIVGIIVLRERFQYIHHLSYIMFESDCCRGAAQSQSFNPVFNTQSSEIFLRTSSNTVPLPGFKPNDFFFLSFFLWHLNTIFCDPFLLRVGITGRCFF